MKTLALSNEEVARTGFTHKAILSYAQGDFSTAATTQSWTLYSTAAGEFIRAAARKNVTQLAGTSITVLAGILGDGSDDDGYLTSKSVLSGATPIDYQVGDGAYFNQAGGNAYTSAGSLIFKLTATGGNISAMTQGEIHLYFAVGDLTKV